MNRFILRSALSGLIITTIVVSSCKKNYSGKGLNVSNIDTTVSPAENFYLFANGEWLKNNPVPASESRWGSFNELQDFNYNALKTVMEEAAAANAEKGSNTQKVGDFYYSGMDSAGIEKAGINPLLKEFERIASVSSKEELPALIALYQTYGARPFYSFFADQDLKNSMEVVPYIYQGGLTLPDRDYYFKNDERSATIRKEFLIHVAKMLELSGESRASAITQAETIMKIETNLARASKSRVELRDPNANYNKMDIKGLNRLNPAIDWNRQLTAMGVPEVEYVIVGQPDFLKGVQQELEGQSLDNLKLYIRWRVLNTFAGKLSNDFVVEDFRFRGTVLTGAKALKPRWKRVLQDADQALGEALGEVYVKKNFTPETKAKAMEMVNNIAEVFKDRIKNLEWMEPPTKTRAIVKLNAFLKKIGYPDKWKDYSKLEIDRGPYVLNYINANVFAFKDMVDKIGKPVDKTLWGMTPPTVNAYYNPSLNEIVFPAGIMQPPFFDPEADDAVNYGGMGAVIGHEMTHGFDDQGRQFDAEGNLKDWWSPADAEKFVDRADVVVQQFDNYTVLDTMRVNGRLTLGENIADLGGLSIAYEAFKRTEQGKSGEKLDGFTPEQRFFLAWAQIWRNNITDEALAQRIITDSHSPGIYRTNGPLSNMPEFYAAFNVKPGDPMYRPDSTRARIW